MSFRWRKEACYILTDAFVRSHMFLEVITYFAYSCAIGDVLTCNICVTARSRSSTAVETKMSEYLSDSEISTVTWHVNNRG